MINNTEILSALLKEEIKNNLSDGNIVSALDAITSNKYEECLKSNCWDLIPIITQYIKKQSQEENPDLFECCEKLLEIICEKSQPEEALLEFLEQIELVDDDVLFMSLLQNLQWLLLKLSEKRGHSFEWCLIAIKRYICKIPSLSNYDLEDSENLLLDSDINVQRLNDLYEAILRFIDPFVKEIDLKIVVNHDKINYRNLVICFLFQIFNKPFATLHFEKNNNLKNKSRLISEKIINLILNITSDCLKYLVISTNKKKVQPKDPLADLPEEHFETNIDNIPKLCFGIFYYFIFYENVGIDRIPLVYNPIYIFQCSLSYATALLEQKESSLIRKGLLLSEKLIDFIPDSSTYMLLDLPDHSQFNLALFNVMIYCKTQNCRQCAIKNFQNYLRKFEFKGRYLLIMNISNAVKHSGTQGFLITKYKDMLVEYFHEPNKYSCKYLTGYSFKSFIKRFAQLYDGPCTDLIINSDQIVSILNILIYVLIRDKKNVTGFNELIPDLKENFLKELREGLNMSKAHYDVKKFDIKKKHNPNKKDSVEKVTVSVDGDTLTHLPSEEQLKVIETSLNCLDLMDSLLSRVIECIEDRI